MEMTGIDSLDAANSTSTVLARRCTGTNRFGEQCGRRPIAGGSVCVFHGGSTPQVQRRAKLRLLALVEPVLDVFEEAVDKWRSVRCDKCGNPTGDIAPLIAIGKLVLDRSGFGPSATLTVTPADPSSDDGPWLQWMTTEELQTIVGLIDGAKRRMEASDVVVADGVCVEDEPIEPTDR